MRSEIVMLEPGDNPRVLAKARGLYRLVQSDKRNTDYPSLDLAPYVKARKGGKIVVIAYTTDSI